jgi:hypothetical protein
MRVVFGDAFDEGAWPGPLGSADGGSAVLDEIWAGVEGLTQTLEVRLGLLQLERPSPSERAAELARQLRAAPTTTTTAATTAPWERSLAVDPLATARSLLRLRDALVEVGVDDNTDPARLPEFKKGIRDESVGFADIYTPKSIKIVSDLYAYELERFGYKAPELK